MFVAALEAVSLFITTLCTQVPGRFGALPVLLLLGTYHEGGHQEKHQFGVPGAAVRRSVPVVQALSCCLPSTCSSSLWCCGSTAESFLQGWIPRCARVLLPAGGSWAELAHSALVPVAFGRTTDAFIYTCWMAKGSLLLPPKQMHIIRS